MVAATVINPNLKNWKLSYQKGGRHSGLRIHSSLGVFGSSVLSSFRLPGAAEGAHTTGQTHRSTAASPSVVCHSVHFLAQGKHIFAGNARLERVRLGGQTCLEGRWKEEAEGNPVLEKIPSGNGESLIHTVTSSSTARLCGNYNAHAIGGFPLLLGDLAQMKEATTPKAL